MKLSILIVLVAAALSGCDRARPTLAGGKPVSHWIQALQDSDPKVRKTAVFKLGNVGSTDPAALPGVTSALRDRDAKVRVEAILALMKFGPAAREAIPELTALRQDRDAQVRTHADKALARLAEETDE
jgi:HEAT repeat protein